MNAMLNSPVQEIEGRKVQGKSVNLHRFQTGNKYSRKGKPNKTTKTLKQAVLLAAEQAGNRLTPNSGIVGYLLHVAETEPRAFVGLLGRTLPLDVTSSDGSMRPVVALYMPDNRRDAKLVNARPVIDVTDTVADDTPALPAHSPAMPDQV